MAGLRLHGLRNVERIESAVHYLRKFRGQAILSYLHVESDARKVEFEVEHQPLGGITIRVRFLENVDYPLVPLIRLVREEVERMEKARQLP